VKGHRGEGNGVNENGDNHAGEDNALEEVACPNFPLTGTWELEEGSENTVEIPQEPASEHCHPEFNKLRVERKHISSMKGPILLSDRALVGFTAQ
jgi:hypothetical protein